MKKIIMSVLAIALAVGVVSSAAYALFTTTATVQGITMVSGNANLAIYDGGTTLPINDFIPLLNTKLVGLFPGFRDYTKVDFKNTSASNIGLNLKMQLTSAGNNWGELSSKIYIAVTPYNTAPTGGDWKTLAEWNAGQIPFGSTLAHGATDSYRLSFAVDDNADNSIANMWLSNVTFVVTGTQATP